MNGRIIIDVTVSDPPDETYQFAVQRPAGTTLEEAATVLNIVVRNLRKKANDARATD